MTETKNQNVSPVENKFFLRPEYQQYCFLIPVFPNSDDIIVSELTACLLGNWLLFVVGL